MQEGGRWNKGESVVALLDDYTVIDLETTGLSPECDEPIELAAVKVRGNVVAETYQQLIHPCSPISPFISGLTGITNDMVADMPVIDDKIGEFLDFIDKDVVVGHNVYFDVGFVARCANSIGRAFLNNYINTIRLARKKIMLPHYGLVDLCECLNLEPEGTYHRALCDCMQTHRLYQRLKSEYSGPEEVEALFKRKCKHHSTLDARAITSQIPQEEIDKDNPLYGKHVVFTGTLERFTRAMAMQLVANLGGINENSVTRRVDFLVLGYNDYCPDVPDWKSSKMLKAEKLMSEGYPIQILDERTFYDFLSESE